MNLKIKMNSYVRVKVTAHGENILRKSLYYSRLTKDKYLEVLLWELMKIFGESLRVGMDIPFEDNIVEVLE